MNKKKIKDGEMSDFSSEVQDENSKLDQIKAEEDEIKAGVDEIREDLKGIKEDLEKGSKEQEDFKSKFYYLAAEMDNMRKRYEREKSNLLKYGNEKVLSELIEVVDNLERTITALESDSDEKVKNIVDGINMVLKQFVETLKQNGLEPIESVGKIFDPNFHEAIAQQSVEGKKDQEIIQEYQKGYLLNGRLLRAAKVVIAKND